MLRPRAFSQDGDSPRRPRRLSRSAKTNPGRNHRSTGICHRLHAGGPCAGGLLTPEARGCSRTQAQALRELLARIRAVLRRAQASSAAPVRGGHRRYRFGNWVLDVGRRELEGSDGVATALSTAEFRLLQALVERPGMVLTRDQLLDITAGRSADVFDRSIDNIVSRLRKKIEADPREPRIIKTVWGEGYTLAAEVTREGGE